MAEVTLDGAIIKDWESFHNQCAQVFGFPNWYGANLNAFIDCLSYLSEGDGLANVVLSPQEMLRINIDGFERFSGAQPEIACALLEAVATINQRYVESEGMSRLAVVPR